MDIKKLRKLSGLTQIELAVLAGIDRMRLSFAECKYIELNVKEQSAVRKAIAEAAARNAERATRDARAAMRQVQAVAS
jgi:transcriptional regulator with XRE-family HTH domain